MAKFWYQDHNFRIKTELLVKEEKKDQKLKIMFLKIQPRIYACYIKYTNIFIFNMLI